MSFHFYNRSVILFVFTLLSMVSFAQTSTPLKIGIAGLTHTHVHWIFNSAKRGEIEIVGIAEPNKELASRYAKQYGIPPEKIYNSLQVMTDATHPEAVAAFNTIYEHLEVVKTCAPRGIHVIVEKPLAVSLEHAVEMKNLALKNKIYLLTNYETTWYPSVHETYEMIHTQHSIGDIKKIVVHDGHQGPKDIGVDKEFLEWLTDPQYNGAGALTDFGCYGADIATWLMKGEKPVSVTAITQQLQPQVYPKVDDEATIILVYLSSQVIIQASWNWPFSRKDLEVYGKTGYILAKDGKNLTCRLPLSKNESTKVVNDLLPPNDDPFAFLAAVIRGKIKIHETDLSALNTNLIVMEILEAAKQSAKEGKTIYLKGK